MKFQGFPARCQFTPVPDLFLNRLVPEMNAEEVRLMLAIFSLLYRKKGYPRYVTEDEIAAHPALAGCTRSPELLQGAVDKGMLIQFMAAAENNQQPVFVLNNPEGQKALAAAVKGELKLTVMGTSKVLPSPAPAPDIFTIYEKNIGLLSPMIAEELKDALETYPEDWIRDAIKEAVSLNKRSIRYIQRILENWTNEGKNNATYRQDSERDKFVQGRYGGLVQR